MLKNRIVPVVCAVDCSIEANQQFEVCKNFKKN